MSSKFVELATHLSAADDYPPPVSLCDYHTLFKSTSAMPAPALFHTLEEHWFQKELLPWLGHRDVMNLALMTLEVGFHSLWRALVFEASVFPPISRRMLVDFAVEQGMWHSVVLLQDVCRRDRYTIQPQISVRADQAFFAPFADDFRWVRGSHWIYFLPEAIYSAAERGCLEEVMWLHCHIHYNAELAVLRAAKARHLTVVQWLLDNHNSIRMPRRQRVLKTVVLKTVVSQHESTIEAICWYNTADRWITHCVTADHGYLPPRGYWGSFSRLYPLMDWAAKQGELVLLQQLHADPVWQKTFSARYMEYPSGRGDLAMLEWLHEQFFQKRPSLSSILIPAAANNQVVVLDWFNQHYKIRLCVTQMYGAAIQAGHVDVIHWLEAHFAKLTVLKTSLMAKIENVANLEVWQYLYREKLVTLDLRYIWKAARSGRADIVLWMAEQETKRLVNSPELRLHLLDAVALGGDLSLTQWCIQDLGAWSPNAFVNAVRSGSLPVLKYLFETGEQRAMELRQSLSDVLDFRHVDIVSMLLKKPDEACAKWLMEHVSRTIVNNSRVNLLMYMFKQHKLSWNFMRYFLTHLPTFSWFVPRFPVYAILHGKLDDLKTLEEMQHPFLFSRYTLGVILKHTRKPTMMTWYLSRCDASLVDMRVVSWAARYGFTQILSDLLVKLHIPCEIYDVKQLKFFGTVIWSAMQHDHSRVYDWIEQLRLPYATSKQVWKHHTAKMAAKRGQFRCLKWFIDHGKVPDEQVNMTESKYLGTTRGHA